MPAQDPVRELLDLVAVHKFYIATLESQLGHPVPLPKEADSPSREGTHVLTIGGPHQETLEHHRLQNHQRVPRRHAEQPGHFAARHAEIRPSEELVPHPQRVGVNRLGNGDHDYLAGIPWASDSPAN